MGERAEELLASFQLSAEEEQKYSTVSEYFERHFIPRRNLIYERACFLRRKQDVGESAEKYITSLHTLGKTCEWGLISDDMILMTLIVGMRDKKLSDQLQLDSKLTLAKAAIAVRQAEEIARQRADLQSTVDEVGYSSTRTPHQQSRGQTSTNGGRPNNNYKHQNTRKFETTRTNQMKCGWCGNDTKHQKSDCPAKESKCHSCGIKGHYSRVCRRQKVSEVDAGGDETGNVFVGILTVNNVKG